MLALEMEATEAVCFSLAGFSQNPLQVEFRVKMQEVLGLKTVRHSKIAIEERSSRVFECS